MNQEKHIAQVIADILRLYEHELTISPFKYKQVLSSGTSVVDYYLVRDSQKVLLDLLEENNITDKTHKTLIKRINKSYAPVKESPDFARLEQLNKKYFTDLSGTSAEGFEVILGETHKRLKEQIQSHYSALQTMVGDLVTASISEQEIRVECLDPRVTQYKVEINLNLIRLQESYLNLLMARLFKKAKQDIFEIEKIYA